MNRSRILILLATVFVPAITVVLLYTIRPGPEREDESGPAVEMNRQEGEEQDSPDNSPPVERAASLPKDKAQNPQEPPKEPESGSTDEIKALERTLDDLEKSLEELTKAASKMGVDVDEDLARRKAYENLTPGELIEAFEEAPSVDEKISILRVASLAVKRPRNPDRMIWIDFLSRVAREDDSKHLRIGAIIGLMTLPEQEAVQTLIDKLEDPDPKVRWYAAEGLGWVKGPQRERAFSALVDCLRGDDEVLKEAAVLAISVPMRDLATVPLLWEVYLNAGSPKTRLAAIMGISEVGGEKAGPYLEKIVFQSTEVSEIFLALEQLSVHDKKKALEIVKTFLTDPAPFRRGAAVEAAKRLWAPEQLDSLSKIGRDSSESSETRIAAIQALIYGVNVFGSSAAISTLIEDFRYESDEVLLSVRAWSLAALRCPLSKRPEIISLIEEKGLRSSSENVRSNALAGLFHILRRKIIHKAPYLIAGETSKVVRATKRNILVLIAKHDALNRKKALETLETTGIMEPSEITVLEKQIHELKEDRDIEGFLSGEDHSLLTILASRELSDIYLSGVGWEILEGVSRD